MTKVITIAGFIGMGKSSLAEMIGERYKSRVEYEKIESPFLRRWYTETEDERQRNRTAILTQYDFLIQRYKSIRNCLLDDRSEFAVLDRSIFEDELFCRLKWEEKEISDDEFNQYLSLRDVLLMDIDLLPQKAPHLTIYIRGSFETAMSRIWKRGRDFETTSMDESMRDWFYKVWSRYDDYMFNQYKYGRVIVIDADRFDFIEDQNDRAAVLDIIHQALMEQKVIQNDIHHSSRFLGKSVKLVKCKAYENIKEATVIDAWFSPRQGGWTFICRANDHLIKLYPNEWVLL